MAVDERRKKFYFAFKLEKLKNLVRNKMSNHAYERLLLIPDMNVFSAICILVCTRTPHMWKIVLKLFSCNQKANNLHTKKGKFIFAPD